MGVRTGKKEKMGGGGVRKRGEEVVNKSFCFHGNHQLQVQGDKALEDVEKDGLSNQMLWVSFQELVQLNSHLSCALEAAFSSWTT